MSRFVASLLFWSVELILLPFTLVGSLWYMVKLLVTTRRQGISVTAYEPLLRRWMLHQAGVRRDEICHRLFSSLPAASPLILQLMFVPTLVSVRLSGLSLPFLRYPVSRPSTLSTIVGHRTEFFDQGILDHLSEIRQVVILGAGWDTRAYTLLAARDVRIFEVDTDEMQQLKRAALSNIGIDTTPVTFVAVDFNQEFWLDALKRRNFDIDLPTFFLWEGVVYYLQAQVVHTTLDAVGSKCARGSLIAFDFPSREIVDGAGPLIVQGILRFLRLLGEPWLYGISTEAPARERVVNILAKHGLGLKRYEPMGDADCRKWPFGGLVLAVVGQG